MSHENFFLFTFCLYIPIFTLVTSFTELSRERNVWAAEEKRRKRNIKKYEGKQTLRNINRVMEIEAFQPILKCSKKWENFSDRHLIFLSWKILNCVRERKEDDETIFNWHLLKMCQVKGTCECYVELKLLEIFLVSLPIRNSLIFFVSYSLKIFFSESEKLGIFCKLSKFLEKNLILYKY